MCVPDQGRFEELAAALNEIQPVFQGNISSLKEKVDEWGVFDISLKI